MVGVAQLVEHRVVVPGVAGSSPVAHPKRQASDLRKRGIRGRFLCLGNRSGNTRRSPPSVRVPNVPFMASIQTRVTASGETTYRVMFRVNGHQLSEGFTDPKAAGEFLTLVDRVGGDAARQIRLARATSSAALRPSRSGSSTAFQHATGVTPGTIAEYRRLAVRTWLPHLGPLPVEAITRDHVKRWVGIQTRAITIRGTPTAAKTIANAHNLLSTVLSTAVPELRPDNPARGVQLPSGIPGGDDVPLRG